MKKQSVIARRNEMRLRRLIVGDRRSDEERVFDAANYLADEIETVEQAESRILFWGEALNFVTMRARRDWLRTTGQQPPLEGPKA